MNNFLSQKWCLCLNVQKLTKLCRAKNHKFGDETTVHHVNQLIEADLMIYIHMNFSKKTTPLHSTPLNYSKYSFRC